MNLFNTKEKRYVTFSVADEAFSTAALVIPWHVDTVGQWMTID